MEEDNAEIIDKICDYSSQVNLKGLLHEYLKRFIVEISYSNNIAI